MLIHETHLADPDTFYDELIAAQRDLGETQAETMNAKLLLVLANHIGDLDILREAIAVAQRGLR